MFVGVAAEDEYLIEVVNRDEIFAGGDERVAVGREKIFKFGIVKIRFFYLSGECGFTLTGENVNEGTGIKNSRTISTYFQWCKKDTFLIFNIINFTIKYTLIICSPTSYKNPLAIHQYTYRKIKSCFIQPTNQLKLVFKVLINSSLSLILFSSSYY